MAQLTVNTYATREFLDLCVRTATASGCAGRLCVEDNLRALLAVQPPLFVTDFMVVELPTRTDDFRPAYRTLFRVPAGDLIVFDTVGAPPRNNDFADLGDWDEVVRDILDRQASAPVYLRGLPHNADAATTDHIVATVAAATGYYVRRGDLWVHVLANSIASFGATTRAGELAMHKYLEKLDASGPL